MPLQADVWSLKGLSHDIFLIFLPVRQSRSPPWSCAIFYFQSLFWTVHTYCILCIYCVFTSWFIQWFSICFFRISFLICFICQSMPITVFTILFDNFSITVRLLFILLILEMYSKYSDPITGSTHYQQLSMSLLLSLHGFLKAHCHKSC